MASLHWNVHWFRFTVAAIIQFDEASSDSLHGAAGGLRIGIAVYLDRTKGAVEERWTKPVVATLQNGPTLQMSCVKGPGQVD